MPKADPIKNNFIFGEISSRYKGQPDSDIYKGGVDFLQNYFVSPQGSIYRRHGTKFLFDATSDVSALISDERNRVFLFYATDLYGSTPYLINIGQDTGSTFFTIRTLDGTSAVTAQYLVHEQPCPVYSVRVLQVGIYLILLSATSFPFVIRTTPANTPASWGFSSAAYHLGLMHSTGRSSGPWMDANTLDDGTTSAITLTPGALTGTTTLTASSALFTDQWLHRQIRLFDNTSLWKFCRVSSYTSTTVVDIEILETALGAGSATARAIWQLGLWSHVTGFPSCGTFYQNRLWFGGVPAFPDRVDFSETDRLARFDKNSSAGVVGASNSAAVYLRENEQNQVNWLRAKESTVIGGTDKGNYGISVISDNYVSPTTVEVTKLSSADVADSDCVLVDKSIVSIARSRLKLYETRFTDRLGGQTTREIPFIDEYILAPDWQTNTAMNMQPPGRGVQEIAYSPGYSRLFFKKNDGDVIGSHVVSNDDRVILAPFRLELGGTGGVSGGPSTSPRILSVTSLSAAVVNESIDNYIPENYTVFLVQRLINASVVYFVEALLNDPDVTHSLDYMPFLDCHTVQKNSKYITAITNANPGVVTTSAAHGFSNGDRIRFKNIQGMTGLGTGNYQVANVTATTFEINAVGGGNTNTTGFGTFRDLDTYKAEVFKLYNTVTGISHLNGETVRIFADGQDRGTGAVSAGSVSLGDYYAIAVVGYWYTSQCRLLKSDFGSATGTALTKTQRVHRVGFEVDRIVDFQVGGNFTTMHSVRASATTLYSGSLTVQTAIDYELGNRICIEQENGYPGTILAVVPSLHTQDR